MGEEIERRHHFVVGVFVAEGDVVHFLKVVQDEKTASMLSGLDAVLVVEASVPKHLGLSLLPRFGLLRDRWAVLVKVGVVLVERDRHPGLILVGRVGKEEAGDFFRFQAFEANRETCLEEDLSESSEVVILGLA